MLVGFELLLWVLLRLLLQVELHLLYGTTLLLLLLMVVDFAMLLLVLLLLAFMMSRGLQLVALRLMLLLLLLLLVLCDKRLPGLARAELLVLVLVGIDMWRVVGPLVVLMQLLVLARARLLLHGLLDREL
jgi:hypothetical protein